MILRSPFANQVTEKKDAKIDGKKNTSTSTLI